MLKRCVVLFAFVFSIDAWSLGEIRGNFGLYDSTVTLSSLLFSLKWVPTSIYGADVIIEPLEVLGLGVRYQNAT